MTSLKQRYLVELTATDEILSFYRRLPSHLNRQKEECYPIQERIQNDHTSYSQIFMKTTTRSHAHTRTSGKWKLAILHASVRHTRTHIYVHTNTQTHTQSHSQTYRHIYTTTPTRLQDYTTQQTEYIPNS